MNKNREKPKDCIKHPGCLEIDLSTDGQKPHADPYFATKVPPGATICWVAGEGQDWEVEFDFEDGTPLDNHQASANGQGHGPSVKLDPRKSGHFHYHLTVRERVSPQVSYTDRNCPEIIIGVVGDN